MFGLTGLQTTLLAVVIAAIAATATIGFVYHKGEVAASAVVTSAVEHTTNVTVEKAVQTKEKADAKVNALPDDAAIDLTK